MILMIVVIITAVVLIVILGFVLYVPWLKRKDEKRNEWDVLSFIQKHPDKAALYLMKNNKVLAKSSKHQVMPLASTVKIMIAIEYAKQAAKGHIDQNQLISLTNLESFYIPKTDGGAHEAWLEKVKKQNQDSLYQVKVPLHEVAKGMIQFSSNANTAYLLELLGLEQVNRNLQTFNLDKHEEIYYFPSSFLIPAYLSAEEFLSKGDIKRKMKQMTMQDYKAYAGIIHGLLRERKADHLIDKTLKTNTLDFEVQKIISNRLPGATIEEYGFLMSNINRGVGFEEDTLMLLKDLLERNPKEHKSQLTRFGGKGGSTMFIHNNVLYATVNGKNNFVLGVFINDPAHAETIWIEQKIGTFMDRVLTDQTFQDNVVSTLS